MLARPFGSLKVPNLVYELVLGGALTSAMVPVLARSAEHADADPAERARVSQITSALLTWSAVILMPLTLALVAAGMPIAALLNPVNANADCPRAEMINATGHMLVVFTPQVVLYGFSVVLYGLLQAYRRFAGPTLRPAWRFPPGVARWAGGLALVGVAELVVIDLSSVVTIALANGRGSTGALVIFNYASQVFNSMSAVLAMSVVISAFPVLSPVKGRCSTGPAPGRHERSCCCPGSARPSWRRSPYPLLASWPGSPLA